MGDLYIRVIPTDPEWQPTVEAADDAVGYVAGLFAKPEYGAVALPRRCLGWTPWWSRLSAASMAAQPGTPSSVSTMNVRHRR
jgi:hypothetical protein